MWTSDGGENQDGQGYVRSMAWIQYRILTVCRAGSEPPHFHPEFGRFMLEATPAKPWGIDFKDLLKVEGNMKRR